MAYCPKCKKTVDEIWLECPDCKTEVVDERTISSPPSAASGISFGAGFEMPEIAWGHVRAAFLLCSLIVVAYVYWEDIDRFIPIESLKRFWEFSSRPFLKSQSWPLFRADGGGTIREAQSTNRLNAGSNDSLDVVEVSLNDVVELDFKSKAEIYSMRKAYAQKHEELLLGDYFPSEAVFGAIEDGKPWWGLKGQLCNGNGAESIEGPSEEARFIANPFLLLGLDEDTGFVITGASCFPVYPRPLRLVWHPKESRAQVTYDMTRFYREKKMLGVDTGNRIFMLDNLNARDFGFNYVYAVPALSKGIDVPAGSGIFTEPSELKSYIHTGGSCGIQGGCNNRSPKQDHLHILQPKPPASLYVKLWTNKPSSVEQTADFTYIIEFT